MIFLHFSTEPNTQKCRILSDQEISIYGLNTRTHQYGLISGTCGLRDEAEVLF